MNKIQKDAQIARKKPDYGTKALKKASKMVYCRAEEMCGEYFLCTNARGCLKMRLEYERRLTW